MIIWLYDQIIWLLGYQWHFPKIEHLISTSPSTLPNTKGLLLRNLLQKNNSIQPRCDLFTSRHGDVESDHIWPWHILASRSSRVLVRNWCVEKSNKYFEWIWRWNICGVWNYQQQPSHRPYISQQKWGWTLKTSLCFVVHKKSDCHIIILRKLMGRVSTQGYLKPPTFQTYAINMQDAMNIHEF